MSTEVRPGAPVDQTTADRAEATSDLARRARRSRLRRERAIVHALRASVILVVVVVWQVGADRLFDSFFVSRPSEIASQWFDWARDGTLATNALSTFVSVILGFTLGGVAAIVVGYALGTSRWLSAVFEPFITAVYSVPKLALVPLFVMWFGIGRDLQILVAGLITFFLMFYNTYFGVREVDKTLLDAVRIMGGSRWDVAVRVRLPAALIWVVAGMKISIPQALVGVVITEILASNQGLGYLLTVSAGQFDSAGTFAVVLTLLAIGLALERVSARLTRRALAWKGETSAVG